MAFDYFQKLDDEQEGGQGQPRQLGQESAVVTGNDPNQNKSESGGAASGSFTNLNSYLDANKDQKFGQQVVGKVQNEITSAEKAQNTADTGFRGAVDQGSVAKDEQLISSVKQDPTKVDVGAFAKQRDAQYAGPNTLSDRADLYQPAQQQTDKAYSTAQQTKDEGGRKAYLQQEYGAGVGRYDYTPGQQKLDNLLIQQDPESKNAFQGAWENASAAKDKFGVLSGTLNQYASGHKASTADTRASARGAVGIDDAGNLLSDSPINQIYGGVTGRTKTLAEQKQAEYEALRNDLSSGSLTGEEFQKTGLGEGQQTWGVDPTSYWQGGQNPDAASVATSDEQARVAALSKLANVENTFLPDASRVGTYKPQEANKFDLNRYLDQVRGEQGRVSPLVQERDYASGIRDTFGSRLGNLNKDDMDIIRMAPNSVQAQELVGDLYQLGESIGYRKPERGDTIAWLQQVADTFDQRARNATAGIPSNYQAQLKRR